MIRRTITRLALEAFARRGYFLLTREQTYNLVRTGDRAQRLADELLRRAEAAEAKVEQYEADGFRVIASARGARAS